MTCRASPVAATIKVRKHIASSRNVPQRATIDSSAMFPLLHAWLAQSTGPHSLVRPAPRAFPCPDRNSRAIARSSGQGWQQWLQSLAARPVGRLPQQDQCLPDCLAIKPAAGSRGVTGICAPQPQHARCVLCGDTQSMPRTRREYDPALAAPRCTDPPMPRSAHPSSQCLPVACRHLPAPCREQFR
jgi:hypothetical protein